MKMEDFKGKTADELHEMLAYLKKELMNLRFQKVAGELENTARFRQVRRDVARIMTALNQSKSKKAA